MLLEENGYVQHAEHLLRMAKVGEPLFFKNDEEWEAYMLIGGYVGELPPQDDYDDEIDQLLREIFGGDE
jgi:hypothetical protein